MFTMLNCGSNGKTDKSLPNKKLICTAKAITTSTGFHKNSAT